MLTLITGVPGSGKTLYCIEKLLQGLDTQTVPVPQPDGTTVETPRRLYTNINGLLLEHEKIERSHLETWHTWAQPGDLICFDEFQRVWEKAAVGSKVADCIKMLETHRHMGVDFILITQHPQLVHTNVLNLVGRHLHVRRVGNMGMAVVYEWDHCSKALLFKNSITKSPWRYSKKVMRMYKSAEAHTKQPRKIPGLVWFILAGLLAAPFMWRDLYQRLQAKVTGKPVPVEATGVDGVAGAAAAPGRTGPGAGSGAPGSRGGDERVSRVPGEPWTAPRYDGLTSKAVVVPVYTGCSVVKRGDEVLDHWCTLPGGVVVQPPVHVAVQYVRQKGWFYDWMQPETQAERDEKDARIRRRLDPAFVGDSPGQVSPLPPGGGSVGGPGAV